MSHVHSLVTAMQDGVRTYAAAHARHTHNPHLLAWQQQTNLQAARTTSPSHPDARNESHVQHRCEGDHVWTHVHVSKWLPKPHTERNAERIKAGQHTDTEHVPTHYSPTLVRYTESDDAGGTRRDGATTRLWSAQWAHRGRAKEESHTIRGSRHSLAEHIHPCARVRARKRVDDCAHVQEQSQPTPQHDNCVGMCHELRECRPIGATGHEEHRLATAGPACRQADEREESATRPNPVKQSCIPHIIPTSIRIATKQMSDMVMHDDEAECGNAPEVWCEDVSATVHSFLYRSAQTLSAADDALRQARCFTPHQSGRAHASIL